MGRFTKAAAVSALLLSLGGCGGTTEEPPPPATSTGGEAAAEPSQPGPSQPEPSEPAAVAAPATPTGPGQLTVNVEAGGNEVAATVRVEDAQGATVAEGQAGQTFALEAGRYRVYATIRDGDVLVDTPTREMEDPAVVSAGETGDVTVEFGIARVRLDVRRRGRPVARWSAELRRQGSDADPVTLSPSEEHIAISPGRYDATLTLGGEQITVNGLIFQGGARQTVPVNVN